ncbi:glycoside hydrolase family 43 protein [Lentinus brumalis]|uniref:Glycoside hydrolase family 43 protein n=1 Tax=Lentinus brumalis TaxID=2498619 RepID=A0A371D5D9_9APHY|nr:glycoside hydrolase family 43 protein [Polyporus brumalis]
MHLNLWLFVSFLLAATSLASPTVNSTAYSRRATYNNPIKPGGGADPWVLKYGDSYYLLYTTGGNVQVTRSSNLAQWAQTGTVVYQPPSGYTDVWAPELHYINGRFYIYVAMAQNGDNASHRMYVLQGTSTTDPLQPFNLVGQITSSDNNWAIDGTVLVLYFIWSGWADSSHQTTQNLYIAPMSSPMQITGARVLLHEPTPAWQHSGGQAINEGPEILVNNGRTFLIFCELLCPSPRTSAYCLAFMGIDGGADPLIRSNWWVLDDHPVMSSSSVAFGPGHASFPYGRNGVPYIAYHADAMPDGGWEGRTIRTQAFGWNADSSPAFPSPMGFDTAFLLLA